MLMKVYIGVLCLSGFLLKHQISLWRKRAGCLAAGEGRIFGSKCGSPSGCSQSQEGGAPEQLLGSLPS